MSQKVINDIWIISLKVSQTGIHKKFKLPYEKSSIDKKILYMKGQWPGSKYFQYV